jgi:hypothetical protein
LALGIDDPERWLETVPDRTLSIWSAFYQVEPWGNDYERTAAISSLLSAQIALVAATAGTEIAAQPTSDFMPNNWIDPSNKKRKKRVDADSITSAQSIFQQKFSSQQVKR